MSTELLSIYIPTYNRVDRLAELLRELASIRDAYSELPFEVVVSDNGSTDRTYDLVRVGIDQGIVDLYARKRTNLKADANMLDAFRLTKGEFVWILCDDDIPTQNSVRNVLEVIRTYRESISLIYLNRSIEKMDGHIIKARVSDCSQGIAKSLNDIMRSPGVDLLTASTLVLRRQHQMGYYSNLFGSGYLVSPLTLALDALTLGPAYLFAEPQVRYREGDKSEWIGNWPAIWKENVPKVFHTFMTDLKVDMNSMNWEQFRNC